MKKQTVIIAAMLALASVSKAQPNQQQPPKPPTPEERLKHVSEKLNKDLQLNTTQKEKVATAYKAFFADIEKYRNKDGKQQPPPPPQPPVSKEIADKLSAQRDAKIKLALTADQYKKYLEIEKTLRPKRPGKPGEDGPPQPPTNQ